MIKNTLWILFLSIFSIVKCEQTVITTTLNNLEERSAAILNQQGFISAIMLDAATNFARYTTIMEEENLEFPPEILQFIIEISSYQISDFPTSIYIQTFPFENFQTFITHFSWISTYLNDYSMTSFKVPTDYSILTTTIELNLESNSILSTSLTSSIISSTLNPYNFLTSVISSTNGVSSSVATSLVATSSVATSSTIKQSTLSTSSSSFSSSASSSTTVSSISTSKSQNSATILVPNTLLFVLISLFI